MISTPPLRPSQVQWNESGQEAGRTAADGVVAIQTADDGSFAAMVEINSETDFVARDDNFLTFVRSVVGKALSSALRCQRVGRGRYRGSPSGAGAKDW